MIKLNLITGACVAALTLCGPMAASGAPKKSASPEPSASPAASSSPGSSTATTPRALPFHGTVTAVDANAKTFTLAGKEQSRDFKVTDRTKVMKAGAAATMADIVANEPVRGSYWKNADGSLEAKSVKIGLKTDAEKTGSGKKSKKKSDAAADADASPTASPSASPKK